MCVCVCVCVCVELFSLLPGLLLSLLLLHPVYSLVKIKHCREREEEEGGERERGVLLSAVIQLTQ